MNQWLDSENSCPNGDITKNRLGLGDLDLIFKVTAVEKLKIHGQGTSVFSENTVTSYRLNPNPPFPIFGN